jgi:hypothetical protein
VTEVDGRNFLMAEVDPIDPVMDAGSGPGTGGNACRKSITAVSEREGEKERERKREREKQIEGQEK